MNRDEVKKVVLYIVDNYNTERMDVDDDKRMDDLTDECCKVAARQSNGSAEQQTDNSAINPLALCCKRVMVVCQEFDPASSNCQKCSIRPTA